MDSPGSHPASHPEIQKTTRAGEYTINIYNFIHSQVDVNPDYFIEHIYYIEHGSSSSYKYVYD